MDVKLVVGQSIVIQRRYQSCKDEIVELKPDNRQNIACLPCQSQDALKALGASIVLAPRAPPLIQAGTAALGVRP